MITNKRKILRHPKLRQEGTGEANQLIAMVKTNKRLPISLNMLKV